MVAAGLISAVESATNLTLLRTNTEQSDNARESEFTLISLSKIRAQHEHASRRLRLDSQKNV